MIIAMLAARLCAFILRLFKRGATTLPGRIALKIKYNLLTELSRNVHIICVTGTNGKTTTCALIEHALKDAEKSCFNNTGGANMISGVATAFIMNSTLTGRCKKEYAILECDENSFPLIARYLNAEITAVTNLFRDQLDRYGEISHTARKIREGIELTPEAVLVLNADDPLAFTVKTGLKNRIVTFGINEGFNIKGVSDNIYCPECGAELKYRYKTVSQLGDYRCPRCAFRRNEPDYRISDITETGFLINGELASTALKGLYNLYNFCAAAAVIGTLGAGNIKSLCTFSGAFGRMEKFSVNGKTALLLLVKNPAGLSSCIEYVSRIKGGFDSAFALNDFEADGRDVSWIWDSDFTPLKGKCSAVYTLGTRSLDMAVRLKYDGISCEALDGEDYRKLTDIIINSGNDFTVFATYTAMMKMRHLFTDAFGGREFWEQTD